MKKPSPLNPIAVLDSGLGGLTVLSALRSVLPAEDLIYFGDTARLPYGTKSPATVTSFVRQIIQFLLPHNPKHIVLACNTATALALPAIVQEFPGLSISGVIDPGARAAVAAAGAKLVPIIGVIATEATVRSKAYDRAILRRRSLANVLLRPTPLLVPMVEEGRTSDDPIVELTLKQYLQAMMARKMDVLVLGCTHFPLLKPAIARVVGPNVRVIDSAEQCAQDVARRLGKKGLLREQAAEERETAPALPLKNVPDPQADMDPAATRVDFPAIGAGTLRAFVTDDPARFAAMASRFLQMQIEPPELVDPGRLYSAAQPPVTLQAAG
jgi:glutamate racemase